MVLKPSLENRLCCFNSRGFKLRKWVANDNPSLFYRTFLKRTLAGFGEVGLSTQPMPDSKATRDVENDKLRLCPKKSLMEVFIRREMLSALAGQFDPVEMLAPCLLRVLRTDRNASLSYKVK